MRVITSLVLSLSLAAALFACGASKTVTPVDETDPAWDGPPPEAFATLDDEEITAACTMLRDTHMCPECECSAFGNVVGQGRMVIFGTNQEGAEIDVQAELKMTDDGWRPVP